MNKEEATYPNLTVLDFHFDDISHELIEEIPLRTLVEALSNFGGCLGLMTGVFMMSLFEIDSM